MTDMLIPNRPQKGKNIDDILANLPKEEELPKAPVATPATSGFSIEDHNTFYRLPWVDFRYTPIGTTLDAHIAHIEYAKNKPDEFAMASAPTIYRICKELYENQNHPDFENLVYQTRVSLHIMIGSGMLYTLSKINWNISLQGSMPMFNKVCHDFNTLKVKDVYGCLSGPSGQICSPSTHAEEFVHKVLDTTDSMDKVNEVLGWSAGGLGKAARPTIILRPMLPSGTDEFILIGIDHKNTPKNISIATSEIRNEARNALLVRYRGTK